MTHQYDTTIYRIIHPINYYMLFYTELCFDVSEDMEANRRFVALLWINNTKIDTLSKLQGQATNYIGIVNQVKQIVTFREWLKILAEFHQSTIMRDSY